MPEIHTQGSADRVGLLDIIDTLRAGQDYCEAIRLASCGIEDRELGAAFYVLAETAKDGVVGGLEG
ncbi:hypothetical protein PY650_15250 [Rhizobium calliandrae]|uniref:Uncharacterized protein n=1 Tax=Rhizobium calliandrae TaxID=1312182 RepID=A0ABT7KEE8_9HYPH|nr:hypothetical protein [Rhizobium calliandrae]MDL2406995.1 hypothetical protein [Rhizobium calliandrae]